jgi:hypothetical protein
MTISFVRENKKLSNGNKIDSDLENYTLTFKKVETEEDENLANYFIEEFENVVEISSISELGDTIEVDCIFDNDTTKEVKAELKKLKKSYKEDYKNSQVEETTEVEEEEEKKEKEEMYWIAYYYGERPSKLSDLEMFINTKGKCIEFINGVYETWYKGNYRCKLYNETPQKYKYNLGVE